MINYLVAQLPTPTPRPYATPQIDLPLDGLPRQMAYQAVGAWNSFEFVTALQIALILIIIIGGIYLLIRELRTL